MFSLTVQIFYCSIVVLLNKENLIYALQIKALTIYWRLLTIYLYIYIHGIYHWWVLWNSYRKLAWVGFEPTTTEFRSDALTDWAIRLWVQLALRTNFVEQLQFDRLFSVTFHFGCLPWSVATFVLIKVSCR